MSLSRKTVTAQPIQAAPETGPKDPSAEMLIGTGDLLQVTVYGTDFDRQVRVSDSGEISLPLLGSVKVAGLPIRDGETTARERAGARRVLQRSAGIDFRT